MKRTSFVFLIAFIFLTVSLRAQNKTSDFPDLLLINGRVWNGADGSSFDEAVAIRGNTITHVGKSSVLLKLKDHFTRVVDLRGRLVTAGFNDAHIHFLSGSLGLSEIDLTGTQSSKDVISRIAEFARKNPGRKWITGRGWQYTQFTGGLPTKQLLDAITKDRPIFLRAYDGHSAWVNSKALELAGITRDTNFKGFGEIVKDLHGDPTGVLKEDADDLVATMIPQPTREDKLNALKQGLKTAASLGITSFQNASGTEEEFSLYEELLAKKELTARVSIAFSVGPTTTTYDIDAFRKIKNRVGSNPMIRASAVKFMLDGVIESHTGAMLEDYSDSKENEASPKGDLSMPLVIYRDLVNRFDKLGFQIYTHAIGDRAVREALNAYENARTVNGTRNARHRIEHIETISPEDIDRFSELGVLASMEPIHAEPGTMGVWAHAIGEKRLPHSFAWSSLLKSHAKLVFSSDWPACVSLNPIRGLHTAVTRRTITGQPPKGWVPAQKISISEALMAYTKAGALASFEENIKGVIRPGMLADLVVFSQDLFKIEPMKTHETKVVMTIFNGQVIYENKEFLK
jgi:predicted amidohydrolase YtcJ